MIRLCKLKNWVLLIEKSNNKDIFYYKINVKIKFFIV